MRMGTKSLLFGAHQFLWHPLTVLLAWIELYGWPNWKEFICIVIHDWGYWGCKTIEGDDGKLHPYKGAWIASKLFDKKDLNDVTYLHLCLGHSRTLASIHQIPVSKLGWADKLCVKYERWWTYLPRVWLSGEIHEYRQEAAKAKLCPDVLTDREWFEWARKRMIGKALLQDARPPYQPGS